MRCLCKNEGQNKNNNNFSPLMTPYELDRFYQKIILLKVYDPYFFYNFNLSHLEKYQKA